MTEGGGAGGDDKRKLFSVVLASGRLGVDRAKRDGLFNAHTSTATMIDKTYQPGELSGARASVGGAQAVRAGRPIAPAESYASLPAAECDGSMIGEALNNTLLILLCRSSAFATTCCVSPAPTMPDRHPYLVGGGICWSARSRPARNGAKKILARVWHGRSNPPTSSSSAQAAAPSATVAPALPMGRAVARGDQGFRSFTERSLIYKDKRLVNWDPELPRISDPSAQSRSGASLVYPLPLEARASIPTIPKNSTRDHARENRFLRHGPPCIRKRSLQTSRHSQRIHRWSAKD